MSWATTRRLWTDTYTVTDVSIDPLEKGRAINLLFLLDSFADPVIPRFVNSPRLPK